MLTDKIRTSKAMLTKVGAKWTFKYVRTQFIRAEILILALVEQISAGYVLHAAFSKGERTDRLDWFCTGARLVEIFREKDYDCIDLFASFIAKVMDRCCSLTDAYLRKGFLKVKIRDTLFGYKKNLAGKVVESIFIPLRL